MAAREEAARIDKLLAVGDCEILAEESTNPDLTFADFVDQQFLPKYRGWGRGTRRTGASYLNSLKRNSGQRDWLASYLGGSSA